MEDQNLTRQLCPQLPGRGKRHASAAADPKIQDIGSDNQFPVKGFKPVSHRERDDLYHSVIWQIDNWRVIVCRDGIQWIIQRRRFAGRRQIEWKGRSFNTTRDVLIRDWRRHTGDDGSFLLATQPERIGRSL
ncbi:MAG: hypothetical protein ABJX32_11365 [Tateyamaria sp.]|uniref:hypothetical protein n=1 Tax=Tateyamaria sp. TaxID=1929288 RepID=UPI0032A0803E